MGAGLTLCSMFTVSARRERAAYGWGLNDSRAVPEGSCLVVVTCEYTRPLLTLYMHAAMI